MEEEFIISLYPEEELNINLYEEENLSIGLQNEIIDVGVKHYSELPDKPSINLITLVGNKTLDELDIQEKGNYPDEAITNSEIEAIINNFI